MAVAATVGLAALGVWSVLATSSAAAPEPDLPHAVTLGAVEDTLTATGFVRPAVIVDVRASVSGIVNDVQVAEGETVRRGQVLVRLDAGLTSAALAEAEARLRQAYLQDDIARLEQREAATSAARDEFARVRGLFERGLVARDDLRAAEEAYRLIERTRERQTQARQSTRIHIDEARAGVARASARHDGTVIRAPFDATVLRRHVSIGSGVSAVGEAANGGTVLLTLGDARRSAFQGNVTAADARRLVAGMTARIRLDGADGEVMEGVVEAVSKAGELSPGGRAAVFPVVVALTSASADWANVPARAEVVLGRRQAAVVVPSSCVQTDATGRPWALVDTPDGRLRHDLDLGVVLMDQIEIRAGLRPGQVVRCR
jgi:HlyD family secretion protein